MALPIDKVNLSEQSLKNERNSANAKSASKSTANSNFWDTYEHICAIRNHAPVQFLKKSPLIDFGAKLIVNVDKLK